VETIFIARQMIIIPRMSWRGRILHEMNEVPKTPEGLPKVALAAGGSVSK
jgi:hypothetical protein